MGEWGPIGVNCGFSTHRVSKRKPMDRIFDDFIPLMCGVVYLLLIKGVIQLSHKRQMRFNEFIARRKTVMLLITYALILYSLVMITKHLFFS